MPQPCTVCARMDRGDIDRRLAFQVVNVSALARELGVGKDALARHRSKHLPAFLPAFQASADALTLGALQAEAQRLYAVTLDALAMAEAMLLDDLVRGDADGMKHSMTAIARMIREARAGATLLAKLSADAASTNERPQGVANGELDARLAAGLERVMQRAIGASTMPAADASDTHPVLEAEVVPDSSTFVPPVTSRSAHPGGHLEQHAPLTTHTHTPPIQAHTNPHESDPQVEVESRELVPHGEVAHDTLEGKIVHPQWRGNPGASKEERAAAGYGDIPVDDHVAPSDAILAEQLRLAALRMQARTAERADS